MLEENIRYGVRPESSTSQGDRDLSGRTIPALGLSHRHSEFQVKSFGEDSDNFLAVNLSTPNSNTMKTSYFLNFIITAAILPTLYVEYFSSYRNMNRCLQSVREELVKFDRISLDTYHVAGRAHRYAEEE